MTVRCIMAIVLTIGVLGCSDSGGSGDGPDTTDTSSTSDSGTTADSSSPHDTVTHVDSDSGVDTGADTDTGTGSNTTLPVIAGCTIFTADDEWNRDISNASVDAAWTSNVLALAGNVNLHPDFGNWDNQEWGIPINIVPETEPMRPISFDWYPEESDPGPYPFPTPDDARIEGGDAYNCDGDCHLLTLQEGTCMLYESGNCTYLSDGWHCGCGAIFDLSENSSGQRPMGWTSADAAGLSIAAGLIRYSEITEGEIRHAIRFTMPCTRSNYVAPASHYAVPGGCGDEPSHPPMGLRVRLKADYDISSFNPTAQIILRAMKRYGMILADNGSAFYFQAETNPGWNGDEQELKDVPASAFEVITPGPMGP
ncbi:MAG: hypothetical protein JXR76_25865 [Deltaproteobacteria bacterium]|nr:hypothetical protein [Deltaproteobacteria bacterium]